MARVTAEQGAAKWAQHLGQSTEDIRRGVLAVTEAPGIAAARQRAVWLARITQSADKWARRVAGVSLQEWQQSMLDKGLNRIASGAQTAQPKFAAFLSDFLPYVDQGVAKVKAMPKGGVEEGVARAATMIRHNAAYQRKSQ